MEGRKVLKGSHVPGRMLSESAKSLVDSNVTNSAENQAENEGIGRRSQRKRRPNTRLTGFVTSSSVANV